MVRSITGRLDLGHSVIWPDSPPKPGKRVVYNQIGAARPANAMQAQPTEGRKLHSVRTCSPFLIDKNSAATKPLAAGSTPTHHKSRGGWRMNILLRDSMSTAI